MYREHEHSRTRPRVSKACERCKIKKAKCDGLKPCKRCNLDKAPCTYKIRRKTESANVTQRYTNLLLQHHAALTAGLIELYSRSLKGQKWTGPRVEEINGSPSVHRILEELGVIETDDDAANENTSETSTRRIPVTAEELKPGNIGLPPKIKKQPRPAPRKVLESQGLKSPVYSPISASSTRARFPQASSTSIVDEQPSPPRYTTQISSPPLSGVPSRRSSGCNSTPTAWASPEFTEELFTTPVPSPSCSPIPGPRGCRFPPRTDNRYTQAPTTQMGSELQTSDFTQQDVYTGEGTMSALGMPFGSSVETDACNTGYFYDATSCGMGVGMGMGAYPWDGNVGNFVGYTGFGQDYSAWDSGVFV